MKQATPSYRAKLLEKYTTPRKHSSTGTLLLALPSTMYSAVVGWQVVYYGYANYMQSPGALNWSESQTNRYRRTFIPFAEPLPNEALSTSFPTTFIYMCP